LTKPPAVVVVTALATPPPLGDEEFETPTAAKSRVQLNGSILAPIKGLTIVKFGRQFFFACILSLGVIYNFQKMYFNLFLKFQ
jgi:hypothetical protein